MRTTHRAWFSDLVDDTSVNAAAKKAGIHQATLNRQLDRGTLPAESVISLSRAFNISPVQGLVETGYLTRDEAVGRVTIVNWDALSDKDLIKMLLSRVDSAGLLSRPLDSDTIREISTETE